MGACRAAYWTAREIITVARHSAECTGLRARIMPRAPKIITGASIQKATAAPVTIGTDNAVSMIITCPVRHACAGSGSPG